MRKIGIIFLIVAFLSGCATYKYHHGKEPYNKGYVVSRDDYTIVEYTLGKDNTVPNLAVAKERFNRRRDVVEDYYKRMGYIENRAKMIFWDPAAMFLKLVGGIFCLPFIAVSEFRTTHNPAYRAKVEKIEARKDAREAARIQSLKDKLAVYLKQDMQKEEYALVKAPPKKQRAIKAKRKAIVVTKKKVAAESPVVSKVEPAAPTVVEEPKVEEKPALLPQEQVAAPAVVSQPEIIKQEPKIEEVPAVVEQPKAEQKKIEAFSKDIIKEKTKAQKKVESSKVSGQLVAVIVAEPDKGYSPLRVRFYGSKSHAPKGRRIISYLWDFGDGDTSSKENPINTYYSVNLMPRDFTVTLTVQDDVGNKSEATINVQVLNK